MERETFMKPSWLPPRDAGAVTIPKKNKEDSGDPEDWPELTLGFGLHLMGAGRAKGKTITGLAIAEWLEASGVTNMYAYLMEPRSVVPISTIIGGSGWSDKYASLLDQAPNGVLVLDSLTYLIQMTAEMRQVQETLSDVIYKGGLSPKDIIGVLIHDEIARSKRVAVIATVNSELMPTMEVFEGACEGTLNLSSPGSFLHRDRKTREFKNIVVPRRFIESAAKQLGYTRGTESAAFQSIV
jgi:hypothetical protein